MTSNVIERDAAWCLSGRVNDSDTIQSFEIESTPFQIGRQSGLAPTLARSTVSSVHAEIVFDDDSLWIRDLQSTNGTYVNGIRVTEDRELHEGDLIQFANCAFRLARHGIAEHCHTTDASMKSFDEAISLAQFDKLMTEKAVVPHFQPIVSLPQETVIGYEVLGRSRLMGLQMPKDMFLAASQLNLEQELSRMLRVSGLTKSSAIPDLPALFLNTHPAEVVTFDLLTSLRELRKINPQQPITIEVHEAAVTDTNTMTDLREALTELNMQLAYDDFGVGQSRLVELAAVRPDIVKFDMSLIRNVHLGTPSQKLLLANLVRMVLELNIVPLAEGVECQGEHEVCCNVGFLLGQGYHYGKPESASDTSRVV